MKTLIATLIDSGYKQIGCRDHLYTFTDGHITVVVNTHELTGGYAMPLIAQEDSPQAHRYQRITSVTEFNTFVRSYKTLHSAGLKHYGSIKRKSKRKLLIFIADYLGKLRR